MSRYGFLYALTDHGDDLFRQIFSGDRSEDDLDPTDPSLASRIAGTTAFEARRFTTAKEMAQAVIDAAGAVPVSDLLARDRLWAWLSFVLREQLYPLRDDGRRRMGEVHRWYPAKLGDFQKGQRHLVRTPVFLLNMLGDSADHLLCGLPEKPGEVREQLTSQQDMFHPTFQLVARMMYFDVITGQLRRGAGTKRAGSARRLAKVRQQLDVTWDLFALSPRELLSKLPDEFEPFRRHAGAEE